VTVAEAAVAKDSKLFVAQKIVGDAYAKAGAGSADRVILAYEAYLANRPEEAAKGDGFLRISLGYAYMYKAIQADKKGEVFKKAEEQFDRALAVGGRDKNIQANAQKGKCGVLVARGTIEANPRLYDQAITVCDSVLKTRVALRNDASPYYNIGIAYLERNQLDRAQSAANSYIQQKPREFRGYLLRGKIFFKQNKFNEAEGQFNRANELSPNNTEVALARGKNFRKQNQPAKAITLLEKVAQAKSNDAEVLAELSRAYLEDNQAGKAATTADRALAIPGQADNVSLLLLAGDAYYTSNDLGVARGKYAKAHELNKTDNRAKSGLVDTIVRQAYAKFSRDDVPGARKLLMEGFAIDADSTIVNFNLGVIALDEGNNTDAVKYLTVRYKKTPNDLITNRLLGKAYLSLGQKDKAVEHYEKAEAEAKNPQTRNNILLAEIYTEWAPLIIAAGKADEAVEKLELADQFSANQPFQKATQQNLQRAYFRRGYERWRQRRAAEAVADFEGALRYPANLTKNEEEVFTFALGLAYLSAGQEGKATPIFARFSKQGQLGFLKSPWDKIGADFFMAYAFYREGTAASRRNAANTFEKLVPKASGAISVKLKELLRSSWEYVAYDAWTRGSLNEAQAALAKADNFAAPGAKRTIDHNQAVLSMGKNRAAAESTFERLGDSPPEALVNLGVMKDQSGDAKRAYDLWVQARAKGARFGKLDEWIDAKKRIFNF
jgi:tetratricopeptide (TPR) repeat protein